MVARNQNFPQDDLVRDVMKLQRATKQLQVNQAGSAWYDYDVAWTSTGTAPSYGTGTSTVGHYQRVGSTCNFVIDLTFASDATFGTGTYSWSLPFFPAADFGFVGYAHINTSGGTRYGGQAAIFSAQTFSIFFPTAGSPATLSAMTNAVPYTVAVGDRLRVQGYFKVDVGS